MKLITGNKIGNVVNLMIEGKLYTKNCGDNESAVAFYKVVLNAKQNPSDENVDRIFEFLNKNIRIAKVGGFEFEPETGNVYLAGFNTPVPQLLMNTIEDYAENGFPLDSIVNFWKLLMANPDVRVRESLFKFIQTHDFALTDKGYMIVYKSVDFMTKVDMDLAAFVSNAYFHIKKDWSVSPARYVVYKQWTHQEITVETESGYDLEGFDSYDEYYDEYGYEPEYIQGSSRTEIRSTFEYKYTKKTTFEGWNTTEKNVELVGNLDELQKNLDKMLEEQSSTFTDHHTHTMKIKLGVPVKMDRKNCDSDPAEECSYGLHVGATKYVKTFGGSKCPVLVCLVNPMHVVAVPNYDNSKMRVTEYFPFALASRDEDGSIDIVKQPYFEHDYVAHEAKELEELLAKAKENDVFRPETAKGADDDDRSNDEYANILKSRVVDLQPA